MKKNKLDYIVLYLIVACFILAIAAVIRLFALKEGFDGFSLFIIFIVTVVIQIILYISIHSFMDRMLLPIIGKVLSKIPFIRRKIKRREEEEIYDVEYEEVAEQIMLIERKENTEHAQVKEEEKVLYSIEEEPIETVTPQTASLEKLRQEQLQKRALEQEKQINTAVEYTRKTFVLYTSEEDLEVLLQNLQVYINNLDMKEFKPIKVKKLTINDLRHFGWNIWNHFKPRNQMDMASFLKDVFPDVFKETEVESVKRHLRDDEKKGLIKIEKKIDNFQ